MAAVWQIEFNGLRRTWFRQGWATFGDAPPDRCRLSQDARSADEDASSLFGDAFTLAQRIAGVLLTILGLSADEAQLIAGCPLPQIELPANRFPQG